MNGAKAPETPSPVLQEKTVTPETLPTVIGPDEGYDGLSQVTVNPDSQLIPTNIRAGKTVFGVEGTFGGSSSDSLLSKIVGSRVLPKSDPFEGYEVHASDWNELSFNGIVPNSLCRDARIKYIEIPSDLVFQEYAIVPISSGYYVNGRYFAYKPVSVYFTGPNLPRRPSKYDSYNLIHCAVDGFPMSYLTNISSEISEHAMFFYYYGDIWEFPEGITRIDTNGCRVFFRSLTGNFQEKSGTVVLPSTLTYLQSTLSVIGSTASLVTIKIKATTPPELGYASTATAYIPAKIIVPAGTLEAYQTADGWSTYANIMEEATE